MTMGVAYTLEELESYKKAIIEFLLKTPAATFTEACNVAKIPHSTAYALREKDAAFGDVVKAAMRVAHESGGDFAESKLRSKINDGDTACILFYLKTKHKARGYVERVEQTGSDGGAVKVEKVNLTYEELKARAKEEGLPERIFD